MDDTQKWADLPPLWPDTSLPYIEAMAAGDREITDFGNQATNPESCDDISLIQDLERELGSVVQRHRVPPDELQQLFEVC